MNNHVKRETTEFPEESVTLDARIVADATLLQVREAFSKASMLTTKGTEGWQHAVLSSSAGAKEISHKCLENTAANVEAAFGAARAIVSSKTIPEAAAAYTNFLKDQFEATVAQSTEFCALSSKVFQKTFDAVGASVADVTQ
jgi:hypothetical protein